MSKINDKESGSRAKKARILWYIHSVIFAIAQITFMTSDGQTHWTLFGLNPFGEWAALNNPLREWVQIYDDQKLNGFTAIWGLILIIHSLVAISYIFWPDKKGKSNSNMI